ncbi:hypothetical protein CKA32_007035 [Geitlerinema sp. FC II]|nr:hypothetical protein CKA32_007035 [Geitlerinema sp. FC II]
MNDLCSWDRRATVLSDYKNSRISWAGYIIKVFCQANNIKRLKGKTSYIEKLNIAESFEL